MRKRVYVVLAVVAVVIAGLWVSGLGPRASRDEATEPSATAANDALSGGPRPEARGPSAGPSAASPQRATVTLSGRVVDGTSPVPAAEVVLRGLVGEATTQTHADGTFSLEVTPGDYRVAVRGSGVLVAAAAERERIDATNAEAIVGLPEEGLMPRVHAGPGGASVEIAVVPAATIVGRVVDAQSRPVAHAIVRTLHPALRPVLATDIAETTDSGEFTLEVPAGRYALAASGREFAGLAHPVQIDARPRASARVALQVAKGCEIRGRVERVDGTPAGDGAIELLVGPTEDSFRPSGHVDNDGTFRFVTTQPGDVTLRAWPWKEMPSESRTFRCSDGARFTGEVLHLLQRAPSLAGTIVDASGAPVPFAYVDIEPAQLGVPSQQERADADGHWQVHELAPGGYRVAASAPGRGIVVTSANVPRDEPVELRLAGTGRIAGTTTGLANGTIEVAFLGCFDAPGPRHEAMEIAHEPRLVTVTGGRFTIDDVPACDLQLVARWRDQHVDSRLAVLPGDSAHLEVALGAPREKTVHGIVRDRSDQPVANARVTAVLDGRTAVATTGDDGHYTLRTYAGAQVSAGNGHQGAAANVGRANVADEQLDLVIADYR